MNKKRHIIIDYNPKIGISTIGYFLTDNVELI